MTFILTHFESHFNFFYFVMLINFIINIFIAKSKASGLRRLDYTTNNNLPNQVFFISSHMKVNKGNKEHISSYTIVANILWNQSLKKCFETESLHCIAMHVNQQLAELPHLTGYYIYNS